MQCCVSNCASNELKNKKTKKNTLTYHEFPKDSQTRSQWIQGLRLGDWKPTANSVVCSQHLSEVNLVKTELRVMGTDFDGVSPDTEVNSEDTEEELPSTYVCRMCLCTNSKVFNIGENNIAEQYEFLTASKDCLGDILPQHICWECKARLASFARLRSVALRSLELLQVFYETVNSQETTEDVQLIIDRDTNKLSSTLSLSNIQIADYPSNGGLLVVFDVKPDNTVSSYIENRNDNDNNSANITNVLIRERKSTKVQNENDNDISDLSDVNDNLANRTRVSLALNKGKEVRNKENQNDNSEYDDGNDNFAKLEDDYFENIDDTFKTDIIHETAYKNKNIVDYNSGLEDIMYDSDSSNSENDDVKSKVNLELKEIFNLFDDNKLESITQGINTDCTKKAIDENPSIDKDIKETFDIRELSKDEQLKEFLERKESNNYKNAGFKCDICYKGFVHKKTFELHKITHTDVNGPLKCPLCGVHFKSATYLRTHLKESHQNRYSCNVCDYVTGSLHNAKLHVDFHKGTIYKCSQCDKIFQKRTSWFSHIRIHHPSDIVCRLCGYSFVSERGLRNHTSIKHKLEKLEVPEDGPRCVECDIQFSTDTALTTHYQESNKHKDVVPEKPPRKRGAPCDSKPVYANPRKKNNGIGVAVICEVCSIELPNHRQYRWHFEKNHPDQVRTKFPGNFMCELCGLFYSCQAVLQEHKESMHADVKKMYSCQECGKKLTTKYHLTIHKEIHLNKRKRYSCDICENTFSSYGNMYRHKILHENRKFDCNMCGKSFSHPQNRQNHITYVHLKKPLPERRNRVRVKKGNKDSAES